MCFLFFSIERVNQEKVGYSKVWQSLYKVEAMSAGGVIVYIYIYIYIYI